MKKLSLIVYLSFFLLLLGGCSPSKSKSKYVPPPEFQPGTYEELDYQVYTPKNLEPGKKYPLVLSLHGSCSECTDNVRHLEDPITTVWHNYDKDTQTEPTFILAPEAASTGWWDKRDRIYEIINQLIANNPIDKERIYIVGFSMGAAGTWNYIENPPNLPPYDQYDFSFAAATIIADDGRRANPEKIKNLPIWAGVGLEDDLESTKMRPLISKIRAANGDNRGPLTYVTGVNPRFSEFPGAIHPAAMQAMVSQPDYLSWMYSKVNDGNNYPIVKFTSPDYGTVIPATQSEVTVTVDAQDSDGTIEKVDFYVDSTLYSTVKTEPYKANFDSLAAGDHKIEATATDNGGKKSTATLDVSIKTNP
ncbi:Ig-like domain-containing protein [Lyngbya aestuarii]|uniref:Ig-like domain-containing protein n=1 Tax=Lyngbya aestuarii TaxID=118322 RepID=UPI00403DAF82